MVVKSKAFETAFYGTDYKKKLLDCFGLASPFIYPLSNLLLSYAIVPPHQIYINNIELNYTGKGNKNVDHTHFDEALCLHQLYCHINGTVWT